MGRSVARALAEDPRLSSLDVWSLVDEPAAVEETLLPILRTHARPGLALGARGFSRGKVRMAWATRRGRRRFDLVLFLHVGVGRLASLLGGVPHGLWVVGIEVRRALPRPERRAVERARPLLSISRYSADEMRRWNPWSPSPNVVHLGAEPDEGWADASEGPPAPPVSRREPEALLVGRASASERYKGHDETIEAWPSVVAACPGARLRMVGGGDDLDRLRAKASALPEPARSSIRLEGRLSHGDLLAAYDRARAFVLPSTGEGFGLVFVEAMRRGLPCVCGPDSAAEVVVHGETGFVAERRADAVGAALLPLLRDGALAERMGEAGRRRFAETFTFEAFRRRLSDALDLVPRPEAR
jgi:phosphatidylinositol alpha-1,6-mannosyltransferase